MSVVMVRDCAGDRKGKFIPEMALPNPEGFGLEVFERSFNEMWNHHTCAPPHPALSPWGRGEG
jgi:hypothetical protein